MPVQRGCLAESLMIPKTFLFSAFRVFMAPGLQANPCSSFIIKMSYEILRGHKIRFNDLQQAT